MSQDVVFEPSKALAKNAHIDNEGYKALYEKSLADPDAFWAEQGQRIDWMKPYSQISDVSYDAADLHIRWYADGTLNAAANCLDRHLATRGDQTAIIWEGDNPEDHRTITYRELHEEVCKFSNVLKANGARKGDRITIYMPMIPEATVAMLACARIGAVHSVVFGGFSPDALAGRILDCESTMVITADEGVRGGKSVPLKQNTDKALQNCPDCTKSIVVRRTGGAVDWVEGRDVWYHEAMATASADCEAEEINAEDPMFILYTSGSTGKPKGVLHTTGGYMVYASMTHQYVFDYHDGDIYWCTADVGWITGHSYIVYGPLANGAITMMFEGVPTYPDSSRFWQVVDKHKVNIFYTAPTAIRALMREGDGPVKTCDRSSLRLLGTVGEPINPEAWMWYHEVVGDGRCPIVDTWWQTETGGILISGLGAHSPMKPAHAGYPLPGINPVLVDGDGNTLGGEAEGYLCIERPWPSMIRTTYGDHERCRNV
ncbi:MAG: acetate--CoA ligase, partial [Candidatus Puniceispirillaceae bacterium]